MSKTVTKKNPFDTSNDEEEIPGVDSPVDTNNQFTFEGNSLPQNPEDLIKKVKLYKLILKEHTCL